MTKNSSLLLLFLLVLSVVSVIPVSAGQLGKTDVGGTQTAYWTAADEYIVGSVFTTTTGASVENITFYVSRGSGGNDDVRVAIYKRSDYSLIENGSDTVTFAGAAWHTVDLEATATLEPETQYILVIWCNYTDSDISFYYDNDGSQKGQQKSLAWLGNEFPDPLTGVTQNVRNFSIYADYGVVNYPLNDDDVVADEMVASAYGWVNVTVSDADGRTDIDTVQINVTLPNDEYFVLLYTNSTDTFSESSDPDAMCTLDTSTSTATVVNSTAITVSYYFSIDITTGDGYSDVTLLTTDSAALTDEDTYTNAFSVYVLPSGTMETFTQILNTAYAYLGISNAITQITNIFISFGTFVYTNLATYTGAQITNMTNFATEILSSMTSFITYIMSGVTWVGDQLLDFLDWIKIIEAFLTGSSTTTRTGNEVDFTIVGDITSAVLTVGGALFGIILVNYLLTGFGRGPMDLAAVFGRFTNLLSAVIGFFSAVFYIFDWLLNKALMVFNWIRGWAPF